MRKIEQQMLGAIRAQLEECRYCADLPRPEKLGNTYVAAERHNGGEAHIVVALHGNRIAYIHQDGTVRITLAGWNTPTTRSRLNAILAYYVRDTYVCQRRGEPVLYCRIGARDVSVSRREIDSTQWITFHPHGYAVT